VSFYCAALHNIVKFSRSDLSTNWGTVVTE